MRLEDISGLCGEVGEKKVLSNVIRKPRVSGRVFGFHNLYGEDSVHFKSFTLKWTEWFKIIPSTFEVDRMVLKTIPSTSKLQRRVS